MTVVSAEDAISAFLAEYDDNDPFRSTLESALRDARVVMGTEEAPGGSRWPGLMLYLIALELVGKYIRKRGVPPLPRVPGHRKAQRLELAVHYFGNWGDDSALAPTLYGLRCALVHEYGLRNMESRELTFLFGLTEAGPILRPATHPWNGRRDGATNANVTYVNVWKVAEYVENLVAKIRAANNAGTVELAPGVEPEDLLTFGTFVVSPIPK